MKPQALKIAARILELDAVDPGASVLDEHLPAAFRSVMGRGIRWNDPADLDVCNLASRILETVIAFY